MPPPPTMPLGAPEMPGAYPDVNQPPPADLNYGFNPNQPPTMPPPIGGPQAPPPYQPPVGGDGGAGMDDLQARLDALKKL